MTIADEDFGSRRQRGDGRRGPAHARTSPRWPDAPPPGYQDAGPPVYQADYYQAEHPGWTQPPAYQAEYADPRWAGQRQPEYPEWTGQQQPERTGPSAYQAGYPGWTEQPGYQGEYPAWTEQPAYQGDYPGQAGQAPYQGAGPGQTPYQGDYPGQPAAYGQYALHPDHPSWPESQFAPWPGEAPVIDQRPSGAAVAAPLPNRVRPPFTPQSDFPPRADAPPHTLAPRRDLPLHRDMDFYPAPIMQDTITDVANWGQQDVAYSQPAREQIWDAGSSQLASWIIDDANEQAAQIFHRARSQASSSLADAQKEAAEIVRRTGEQAALTIEAAELQAAEIRATMMKLTADLTGMAAYVTQNLSPAAPAAAPGAEPAAAAPARPAGAPRARPATAPGAGPARQPAAAPTARPGAKPNGKSRQHAAVRVMTIFTAAMVVLALAAGASEVALHGAKFFVFRATGVGETGPNGGQEDQGPGQPDAPVAHQQLQKP
jgi:hypothetical protein